MAHHLTARCFGRRRAHFLTLHLTAWPPIKTHPPLLSDQPAAVSSQAMIPSSLFESQGTSMPSQVRPPRRLPLNYSEMLTPEPPISLGRSLSFVTPSLIGNTVS